MGKVTIGDLLDDYEDNKIDIIIDNLLNDYEDDKIDIITGVQAHDIEIVPRKIVEMIIEKCKDHASGPRPNDYIVGVSDEAGWIAKYAKSLLKRFDEFGEENEQ